MTSQPASAVNGSQSDPVNHPQHYNSHPSGVECVEYSELLPGNLSHACVYVWRYKDKGTPAQDLEKALWFLDREIGRTDAERTEACVLLGRGEQCVPAGPALPSARTRVDDRLRHLERFVKEREFVASVEAHLLCYELAEARKLIVHQHTSLTTEKSSP